MSDTIRYMRIVSVPAGEAPLWVGEAWVGVELPDLAERRVGERRGVVTGKKVAGDPDEVVVFSKTAIDALKVKNSAAAQWFEQHAPRWGWGNFIFNRSEVQPIPPPFPPPTSEIEERFL